MGQCPYCETEVTVKADLVSPSDHPDDNIAMKEENEIQLEKGARTFQYVCPSCEAILGAGTHKWAK